nr:immunity 22 family protein [uncultured Acetatifactor sp.]
MIYDYEDQDGYVSLWVNYECFNQFEYDFGMSFDEDFREAAVLADCTEDLEELLSGFSYFETFSEEIIKVTKNRMPKCNAAVVLYNFKYCGETVAAEHEDVSLQFVGYAKYKP